MTASNIPDSFSSEELKALLNDAPKDITDQKIDPENITAEQLQEIVDPLLDKALEQCPGPIVHKAIVMRILQQFLNYHMGMYDKISDGSASKAPLEIRQVVAGGWSRDAGHIQVMLKIMADVQMNDNDPWCFDD